MPDARGRRYVFVAPNYTPFVGGATACAAAMAQRLAQDGCDVTILTTGARRASDFWLPPPAETSLPEAEMIAGVTVRRVPLRYPWPAPYRFGVARRAGHVLSRTRVPAAVQRPLLAGLARSMPPVAGLGAALEALVPQADLVHADDASWDGLLLAAAGAARRHGKPFVVRPLMHLGDARIRIHFQMAHQVEVYRRASAVLALSEREAAEYVRLGVSANRVFHTPMGVDPLPPRRAAETGEVFRSAHGITGPLVAFLGSNTYDKGAWTLALAVADLNRGGQAVDVVFAGPGSELLAGFLERQSGEIAASLQGRARILGVVDEETKHGLLAACDLLALPSQVDTFGIVFLEAWLHGKPVIGAAAGGIPEVVRDGGNGLLVPFGDASMLAAAIRRLLGDPVMAAGLGERGRQDVAERYTWDRAYRELLAIYDVACDDKKETRITTGA